MIKDAVLRRGIVMESYVKGVVDKSSDVAYTEFLHNVFSVRDNSLFAAMQEFGGFSSC